MIRWIGPVTAWMSVAVAANTAAAEPLTLTAALEEAGRANLDLAMARTARQSASADTRASYALTLPKLDVSASFGRDYIGSQKQVRVVPVLDAAAPAGIRYDQQPVWTPRRDFADYTLGMTLKQPLFDGLYSWSEISRARAKERAEEHQLDESTLATAFEVTRLFYEVVRAERSLAVLQDTAQQSQQVLSRVEALFGAGRMAKSEVYASRVNAGNDRINIESQQARAAQARANLALALGRTADTTLEVVAPETLDGPPPAAEIEPPPFVALTDLAKKHRPLLASQAELVAASEHGVTSANANWYPTLGASVAYSRESPNLAGNEGVYGSLSRQYVASAGLFLQWNLFDGGQTLVARQRAVLGRQHATLTAEDAEKRVSVEIAQARTSIIALARACNLTKKNMETADEGVQLANERLAVGSATQLEVRDAALKLTQAKLSYVSARIDYALALADLNRAVGGVLNKEMP